MMGRRYLRGDFARKGIKFVGVSTEGISLEFHDWSERVALHNSWKSRGIDTSSRLAGKKGVPIHGGR